MEKTKQSFILKWYEDNEDKNNYIKNKIRSISKIYRNFLEEITNSTNIKTQQEYLFFEYFTTVFLKKIDYFHEKYFTQGDRAFKNIVTTSIKDYFVDKTRKINRSESRLYNDIKKEVTKVGREMIGEINVKLKSDSIITAFYNNIKPILNEADLNKIKTYNKLENFKNCIMNKFNIEINLDEIQKDEGAIYKDLYKSVKKNLDEKMSTYKVDEGDKKDSTKIYSSDFMKYIMPDVDKNDKIIDKILSEIVRKNLITEKETMGVDITELLIDSKIELVAYYQSKTGNKLDKPNLKKFIKYIFPKVNYKINLGELKDAIIHLFPTLGDNDIQNESSIQKNEDVNVIDNIKERVNELDYLLEQKGISRIDMALTLDKIIDDKLSQRQQIILKSHLKGYTIEEIAKILTEKGMQCHYSTVSREIEKIIEIIIKEYI